MARKLPFKIVGCTGWEDHYHPKNLEVQNPFVKGWRSERYCTFPQQVVIRLDAPTRIRKIQFLSHHSMIASKVELFVGMTITPSAIVDLDHIQYLRLGYISLCDNERNRHRSRELKSINMDTVGQFVRLVLYKNHINTLNIYSQVSLVAVNIIGEDTADSHILHVGNKSVSSGIGEFRQPRLSVAPVHDLAFSICQDPEVVQIIVALEKRKQEAIDNEKFELAKGLKKAIEELTKIGKVVCQLEVQKRSAVEREDFDAAQNFKLQKLQVQRDILQRLGLESLLSGHLPPIVSTRSSLVHQEQKTGSDSLPPLSPHRPAVVGPVSQITEDHHTSPKAVPSTYSIAPRNYSQDERQLPSLVHKDDDHIVGQAPVKPSGSPVIKDTPEPLTAKQLNEAQVAVEVFGQEIVELVYSKQYQHREKGLMAIKEVLSASPTHSKAETLKALCLLLRRALGDKVYASFSQALEVLKHLMGPYSSSHRLTDGDISAVFSRVIPTLLTRLGDNPRIETVVVATLMELTQIQQLKEHLCPLLVVPVSERGVWRQAKGRVQLLTNLFQASDLSSTGVSIDSLMKFVNASLQHSNGHVRDAALELTVELYSQYGGMVREKLAVSRNDSVAMKNPLWRSLFGRLDKMDGVPHASSVEKDFQKVQRRKDAQIQAMKSKLDMLQSLAQKGKKLSEEELMAALASGDEDHSGVTHLDSTCMFCGERNPELKNETRMENHYHMECPMLNQCKHCSQVVEIMHLREHLLEECDQRGLVEECSNCHEAILASQLESHVKAGRCTVPPNKHQKCPLCHANVHVSKEAWQSHLMGNNGCVKNPRRKRKRNKVRSLPAQKQVACQPSQMACMGVTLRN